MKPIPISFGELIRIDFLRYRPPYIELDGVFQIADWLVAGSFRLKLQDPPQKLSFADLWNKDFENIEVLRYEVWGYGNNPLPPDLALYFQADKDTLPSSLLDPFCPVRFDELRFGHVKKIEKTQQTKQLAIIQCDLAIGRGWAVKTNLIIEPIEPVDLGSLTLEHLNTVKVAHAFAWDYRLLSKGRGEPTAHYWRSVFQHWSVKEPITVGEPRS